MIRPDQRKQDEVGIKEEITETGPTGGRNPWSMNSEKRKRMKKHSKALLRRSNREYAVMNRLDEIKNACERTFLRHSSDGEGF